MGAAVPYAFYCNLVSKFLAKESQILDWGGQYGHITKLLQNYFFKVDCFLKSDSEYYSKFWHNILGVSGVFFGNGTGVKIESPDSLYDGVISSGVLEHVRDESETTELEALLEIRRVLKPGGFLFIWNLPCRLGLNELINLCLGRSVHKFKYSKYEITKMLEESGFEIAFYDKHDLFPMKFRHFFTRFLAAENVYKCEYFLSKLPLLNIFAQHHTIVAKAI